VKKRSKQQTPEDDAKAREFEHIVADLIRDATYRATVEALRDVEELRRRIPYEETFDRMTELAAGRRQTIDELVARLVKNVNE
jgi:hypothetical protein